MKLNPIYRPPSFWEWIRHALPSSMEAHEVTWGYGVSCNIYRKGDAPNAFMRKVLSADGYPIATVHTNEVRLNEPQYFSDFEDMLRRFESHTGIEPTLSYWQSPKDEKRHFAAEGLQTKEGK